MILFLLLATFVSFLLYNWWTLRPKNFPPGPLTVPFFGSVLVALKPNMHFEFEKWRSIYGPLIGIIAPGIFLNEGPVWVDQRRFALRYLRDFGFNKINLIENEYKKWLDFTLQKGTIHQVQGLFNNASVNIIWNLISSEEKSHEDPEFNKIIRIIFHLMRAGGGFGILSDILPILATIAPKFSGFEFFMQKMKILNAFFKESIDKHRETLDRDHPRDIIDAYIIEHENNRNSFHEMKGLQVIIFDLFSAGAESVSNSLSFMILYMILYPEVQQKVQDEIDLVLGDAKVTLTDRNRLPYVEATINEIKRCNPVAPLSVTRKVTQNVTFHGYNIPKDTVLVPSLWCIFQDKERYGDPENFRPERFIDKNGNFIRDDMLLFFGAGKRFCIGESFVRNMEFVVFVSLMQDVKLSLPEGEPKPTKIPLSGFTTSPQPFFAQITSRKRK